MRLPRTVVARRVLWTTLLFGGFLLLMLLFDAGSASAAEPNADVLPTAVRSLTSAPLLHGEPAGQPMLTSADRTSDADELTGRQAAVQPVKVVQNVLKRSLAPAQEQVNRATRPVVDAVDGLIGASVQAPTKGIARHAPQPGIQRAGHSPGAAAEVAAAPAVAERSVSHGSDHGTSSNHSVPRHDRTGAGTGDGKPSPLPASPFRHASESAGDATAAPRAGDTYAAVANGALTSDDLTAGAAVAARTWPPLERVAEVRQLPD